LRKFVYFCGEYQIVEKMATTTTRKTSVYDETTLLQKELIALLLKKAGLKEKDVTDIALKRWALKNLDLLTTTELEKYKRILA
jgi:succinate dehydrogenase flavin-adding protein (antitoxin of CptAB toxin-antitoxin module)